MSQLIVPTPYLRFRQKQVLDETTDKARRIASALAQRADAEDLHISIEKDSTILDGRGRATLWWTVWHQPPGRAAQMAARVQHVKGQEPDMDTLADMLRRGDKSKHGSAGAMKNMLDWQNEPREASKRDDAKELGGDIGERLYFELGKTLDEMGTGRLTPELKKKVAGVKRKKVFS